MMSRFNSPSPLQGSFGNRSIVQRRLPPLQQQQQLQQLELLDPHLNDHQMDVPTKPRNRVATSKISKYKQQADGGGHQRKANGDTKHLSLGAIRVGHPPSSSESGTDVDSQTNNNRVSSYVGLVTTPVPERVRRPSPRPRHQVPSHQRSTFSKSVSQLGGNSLGTSVPDLTSDIINQYLKQNPDVLDSFVLSHVKAERIESWLQQKNSRVQTRNATLAGEKVKSADAKTDKSVALSRWKSKLQASKGKVLQELAKDFHNANGKLLVLLELADCVAAAISADSHTLFAVDEEQQKITHISKNDNGEIVFGQDERVCHGTSLAASVALTREPATLSDILENKRNPDGLSVNNRHAHSVLALPIMDDIDVCIGVIEFYRHSKVRFFSEQEKEVAVLLLQWYDMLLDYVEIAMLLFTLGCHAMSRKAETHSSMTRQSTLSDFLLEVTRSIFQDIISMDIVIMKIMSFTQKLVNADRASLFLVDYKTRELYARMFDVGAGPGDPREKPSEKTEDETPNHESTGEIRFSMDKGVAGYVATTGKILNIKDAYKDKRFNREVDIQTGYKTKTILCMPIFIRKNVIGVVQMINKINGRFTKADEKAFETFAIYCGLALHHAKLYEKIRRSEQKYKVALEVLSYHSMATEEEVNKMKQRWIPNEIPNITKYNFSPWSVANEDNALYVLYMFKKLFSKVNFSQYSKSYEIDDVIRFTLTIKKNYRDVPYHNWLHAFSVAHSMYTIIETAEHNMDPIEAIVLFVSCLCHDLDHRGKTNSFMVQSASPLAAIYSTSTMEHHHFNQTVSILQREDHNIFKFLGSTEYKKVLGEMKTSILATDLAVFFKNKVILENVVKNHSFDWSLLEHKYVLRSITMTGCDLCAMTKSWEVQAQTVKVIFEEFYSQSKRLDMTSINGFMIRASKNAMKAVMMTSCDLCNMFKPWSIQYDLVCVIMEEFWQQGDEEKRRGITPVEMMDRDKKDELPLLEVGFMESICLPCYELMNTLMPDTEPMLVGAKANLEKWKAMADNLHKTEDEEDEQGE